MKISENDEPELFLLGIQLLDFAGKQLFETLESHLKPHFGNNWFFDTLVKSHDDKEMAPRDLSVLLVQIVIRNNSNFRLALSNAYFNRQPLTKQYFDHLTDLRVARNEWFHRIIDPITSDEIFDLAETITQIFPVTTSVSKRCLEIINLSTLNSFTIEDFRSVIRRGDESINVVDAPQAEISSTVHNADSQPNSNESYSSPSNFDDAKNAVFPRSTKIGEPYVGSLLPHRYTLKLDGSIIDKRLKLNLFQVLGEPGHAFGKKLLERHPVGGRLRISSDGIIVGYQNEEWVVLGEVKRENWFVL
jgi:hypothetical protein